ncbi:hypothetical protein D3C85_1217250 [compost metagenome]
MVRARNLHAVEQPLDHRYFGGDLAQRFLHLRELDHAVDLGELARQAQQEARLHGEADLALVVLVDVRGCHVPLRMRHLHVVVHEHAVPGHLHFVEVDDGVVLVQAAGQRVVEGGNRRRLVGLAREHLHALGIERNAGGEAQVLLAGLQRLDGADEHFVGHRRGRAQHLRALDGDALGVLVDHAGDQTFGLLPGVLAAVALGIDDDVRQVQVAIAGVLVVVPERLGALCVVALEHVQPHDHA